MRNARVYKLDSYRLGQWAKKGQFGCSFCSKPFVLGDWVLVKSGHDRVRHTSCAVRVGMCEVSDLPEEAFMSFRSKE